jgi:hypothetical protein
LDNACTNERLAIETFGPRLGWCTYDAVKLKISRYPLDATKEWIEANEREIMEWEQWKNAKNRCIRFESELKNADNMW